MLTISLLRSSAGSPEIDRSSVHTVDRCVEPPSGRLPVRHWVAVTAVSLGSTCWSSAFVNTWSAEGHVVSIGFLPVRSTCTEKWLDGVMVFGRAGETASGAAGGLYGVTRGVFADVEECRVVLALGFAGCAPPAAYAV